MCSCRDVFVIPARNVTMKLTRRDALLAFVGGGVITSTALAEEAIRDDDRTVTEADVEVLVALGEVLYPSSVAVTRRFVETSALGLAMMDDGYLAGLSEALDVVRTTSRRETGRGYTSLDADLRDGVLRATGADQAYADPDGTVAQRVRYYVVDGLLYAFYATPAGSGLAGNENPRGYPGGTEVYQQPLEG